MIDKIKPFTAETLDRFVDELSPEEDYNFEGLNARFSCFGYDEKLSPIKKSKAKKVNTKKILKKKNYCED